MNLKPLLPPKKQITAILLSLIILSGFLLRAHHLNFPSIGYHNMKENEFIGMAENMLRTNDFFSRRIDFHSGLELNPDKIKLFPGGHLLAYQIALSRKLFPQSLYLGYARLFSILFFLVAIIFMYKSALILTGSARIALLSAFILNILPLGVYFARNLQPEPHAFMFMLIGIYYYLLFVKNHRFRYLAFSGISAVFIFLYKFTFLACYVPFLFVFPYTQLRKVISLRQIAVKSLLCFIPLVCVYLISVITKEFEFGASAGRVSPLTMFTLSYWKINGSIIKHYIINENYTIFYTFTALGGFLLLLFFSKDSLLKRYMSGWTLAIILYAAVLSDYINQHNYYQMPFLFLAAFNSAYFLGWISRKIDRMLVRKIGILFVGVFVLLSLLGIVNAVKAHYNTVFYGQDVAGRYLNKHLNSNDRFFIYTFFQGYGTCVYAGRKCGWPQNLNELQTKEKELSINYIAIYPFNFFDGIPSDIKDYLAANYHIAHIGLALFPGQQTLIPYTLILRKGGKIDFKEFFNSQKLNLADVYRIFQNKVMFYTLEED